MRLAVLSATLMIFLGQSLNAETYELTFDALWNAAEHPTGFLPNSHFPPIVGASHNDQMTIWSEGALASEAFELEAEKGDPSLLEAMIDGSPNALSKILYPSGFHTPGTVGPITFEVTSEFPLVSFATMIAPSPDWFVGVSAVDLRDGDGFVDNLTLDLFAYDAGTEEGTGFSIDNAATDPPELISAIDQAALFGGTAPLARATFTRVVPEPTSGLLCTTAFMGLLALRRRN